MSMFFYRAWAGADDITTPGGGSGGGGGYGTYGGSVPGYPGGGSGFSQLAAQFQYHRWGYFALLLITLLASFVLNTLYIMSFFVNRTQRKLPHYGFLMLSIRDLIVTFIMIPTLMDWMVVSFGIWNSGDTWCKIAGFFDYTLATEYSLLMIVISLILLTRQMPKYDDGSTIYPFDDLGGHDTVDPITGEFLNPHGELLNPSTRSLHGPPSIRVGGSRTPSVQGSRAPSVQGSRAPSVQGSRAPSVQGSVHGSQHPGFSHPSRTPHKPPSVAGSEAGYRRGGQYRTPPSAGFGAPRRPGSVTGSIEGRMARRPLNGSRPPSEMSLPINKHLANVRGGFKASSPLPETDEEMASIGEAHDLFETASMEYPGRNLNSPQYYLWDFMEPDIKFHQWHLWALISTWLLALALGIPAALNMKHFPNTRPGCYIPVDPFKENPHSIGVNDPGFNFMISYVAITYVGAVLIVIALYIMACVKETKDQKFKRYLKMMLLIILVFIVSRSPVDVIQFKGLIEAAMGFKQLSVLSYELEHEIVLVWTTFLPIFLNPIIYFSYCSEYRQGSTGAIRKIFGCKNPKRSKEEHYKEDEILKQKDTVSRTQESNIL